MDTKYLSLDSVKLTTTSGKSWTTSVAAGLTQEDVDRYFYGKYFDMNPDPEGEELMERVIKVEFNP